MAIPSKKNLEQTFRISGEEASLIRDAMKWAVTGAATNRLYEYYRDKVYSPGQGLPTTYDFGEYSSGDVYVALRIIDKVLGTAGVEYIRDNRDTTYAVYGIEYANTGDQYAATVMYDWGKRRWLISSWGDQVERHPKRFGDEGEW